MPDKVERKPPSNGRYYVADDFMGGNDWLNYAGAQRCADKANAERPEEVKGK